MKLSDVYFNSVFDLDIVVEFCFFIFFSILALCSMFVEPFLHDETQVPSPPERNQQAVSHGVVLSRRVEESVLDADQNVVIFVPIRGFG